MNSTTTPKLSSSSPSPLYANEETPLPPGGGQPGGRNSFQLQVIREFGSQTLPSSCPACRREYIPSGLLPPGTIVTDLNLIRRIPGPMNLGDAVSQIAKPAEPATRTDGTLLISRLSFSHMSELLGLDDPQKREFYEVEAIQGNWSVR